MSSQKPDHQAVGSTTRQKLEELSRLVPTSLDVTMSAPDGGFIFTWTNPLSGKTVGSAMVRPAARDLSPKVLTYLHELSEASVVLSVESSPFAMQSIITRIQQRFVLVQRSPTFRLLTDEDLGMAVAGEYLPVRMPPETEPWYWLRTSLCEFGRLVGSDQDPEDDPVCRGRHAMGKFLSKMLGVSPDANSRAASSRPRDRRTSRKARSPQSAVASPRDEAQTTGNPPAVPSLSSVQPPPPVAVLVELPELSFQDTAFPLRSLEGYSLCEQAARWWVSNQSDDLLCLPNCRITRLDYQVRTALRVLGPLRGRALLSDEVGLGKTIEAGLIIKELLTRGMVKRFLVLTVPSLVDQWEEELADKFGLVVATTNHPAAKSAGVEFWRENPAIVASLHTLKQSAQLEVASQVQWDILVVDEAHYLRNRESLAWQAVNRLPRQFMLLLTATPVQNSLEELYNLVTLLQPGQLPTPREFKARFFNPKRPRQPLEPEELRRLLGQVMIRNTRANAGVQLPPRRAETVLFAATEPEQAFWQG